MKLRLPHALIVALFATSLPMSAQWAADGRTGGHAYNYINAGNYDTMTLPTSTNNQGTSNSWLVTDNYTTVGFVAGSASGTVAITTVQAESGQIMLAAQNPWQLYNITLDVTNLTYGDGTGNGGVLVNANQTATVHNVNGTLSSVTNAGNLTLGNATLSNAISNSGSLNLNNATISVHNLNGFAQEGEAHYSDGANGYVTADYRLTSGSGSISAEGATVSVNGAEGVAVSTASDGNLLFHVADNSTYYYNEYKVVSSLPAADTIQVNGHDLVLDSTSAHTVDHLVLNGGTMAWLKKGNNTNEVTISQLDVIGETALGTYVSSSCWNGTINIGSVQGDADSSLKLYSGSQVYYNTVFHLNGGDENDFHGSLELSMMNTASGDRRIAADINENAASMFSDSVISFSSANGNGHVALGINAENVAVKGLQTLDSNGEKYIFSGAAQTSETANQSDGTMRTLTITPGSGESYTFAGAIKSDLSLVKNGEGEQILSGNLSAFNGDLTVNAGTLAITGTGDAKAVSAGTLTVNGGTLQVGTSDGSQSSLSAFSSVTMAGGVISYNNEHDTLHNVTAQADTNSRIYSFDMGNGYNTLLLDGDTTLNGNLTLHNYWNASFTVEHLTGAGKLTATGAYEDGSVATTTAQDGAIAINSLAGFTGSLDFDSTGTRGTVNHGDEAVSMNTLSVHHGSQVTINSSETGSLSGAALNVDGNSTLTFNGGHNTFTNMGVADSGTEDANVKVNVTNGATLEVTDGLVLAAHGEKISVDGSSKLQLDAFGVTVESIDGEQTAALYAPAEGFSSGRLTYKTNSWAFSIDNAKASFSKGGAVDHKMANTSVVNTSETGAALTVTHSQNTLVGVDAQGGSITVESAASSAPTLASISANGGDVTIKGLNSQVVANLNDLYIADERTVSLYQNGTDSHVGQMEVSGNLTAGSNAHLNADLTLNNGATVNVDTATGGLHLNGALTFAQDSKINLGGDIINGLNSLTVGNGLTLFSGVESFTIDGAAFDTNKTYQASDYVNLAGVTRPWDFVIKFEAATTQGYNISISMETPEPATATLSLLALAALAARRRRH